MRTLRTVVAAALALILCLSACRQKDKIIPRATMTDIYAELFLADQWLMGQRELFMEVDTMRFYEPIFNKYGYTTLDFRNSANYYLQDARRFARILQRASVQLEEKAKHLERLSDSMEALQNEITRLMQAAPKPTVFYDETFFERATPFHVKMERDEWGVWMPELP